MTSRLGSVCPDGALTISYRQLLLSIRRLENRLVASVTDAPDDVGSEEPPLEWTTSDLDQASYCLLTTYRRDGRPVSVPVWFGTDGHRVLIRSGAADGKVKRIRHTPRAAVAACTSRGRRLGPAIAGEARLLEGSEAEEAEHLLEQRYGRARRIYNWTRARLLPMAFIEVRLGDSNPSVASSR
jgi:PPOX class probable F420-dependent enzyme